MSSVIIKSINRQAIVDAVTAYTKKLCQDHPEIVRIIWFGSWVNGLPTPGSDVDLCLILSHSDKPIRERIPDYLPVGFPVGIDLFPYTQAEFATLQQRAPSWYEAVSAGRQITALE